MSSATVPPAASPEVSPRKGKVLLGWLLLAVFVAFCAVVGDYRAHVRWFQAAWLVGFAGYGMILRAIWPLDSARVPGRWSWWLAGFIAFRVALLHTAPSDDLHRYVWEGKIQRHGFSPYVYAPLDDALHGLTAGDPNWSLINHGDYSAIYPPAAQLLFRAVASVSESIYAMKACFVALDIAAVVLLAGWLRRRGMPPQRAAVYALCPLVLSAFAIEGHLDALMLVFVLLAMRAAGSGRWRLCGAAVGLAISAKLVAVVLMPWLLVRRPIAFLLALGVCGATYLPFIDAGTANFDSLLRFSDEGATCSFAAIAQQGISSSTAQLVCGAVLAGFVVYLLVRRTEFTLYANRALAALVVVLPVVHAWYLTWFVALAVVRIRVAWLVLAAAMGLYFEAEREKFMTATWSMPHWVPPAIAAIFVLAWMIETACRRRAPSERV